MNEWREWFDSRLDDAIEAAAPKNQTENERKYLPAHININYTSL